jgi:hypothetical protein
MVRFSGIQATFFNLMKNSGSGVALRRAGFLLYTGGRSLLNQLMR